ncbi:LacI family DNA-binding transcriptional regulator [Candidimonas humi]|uniref:LacI family DNA-binding transcriptional regulator n=1 Tax=Candidimonas humi TaxID=683355 RepID=A0ABV8NUB0_9BURK|nr:LacI family DNA-binding transcriptional regulator [Candidimonas humi]MBV6303345.1 LacI family DNA-binding transcriptional regulator [Candidimonas humi]
MQAKDPKPARTSPPIPATPGKATLADVARVAGVSTITASRALGNPTIVAERTRLKVQQAVSQTGYVPNLLAGGLKSSRSRVIACLVPTISSGSSFMLAVQSLTETLAAAGYQVMLGQRGYQQDTENALIDAVVSRRVDGIVLMGAIRSAPMRRRLQAIGIPVVEAWDKTRTPVDMLVGFSHEAAGAAMANYVHRKGYRQAAMIVASEPRSALRARGFAKAAARHGHTGIPAAQIDAPTRLRHGRAGTAELLALHPKLDVIFCASDLVALGAITELKQRGLRVPEDVAVLGFGDLDFAVDIDPALTTVQIDSVEIGRRSADMLMEKLAGKPVAEPVVDLGFSIIERDSG